MSENSKIEWTDHTFNPVRGCTKISPGCAHCYAEKLSHRNPKVLGEWGSGAPRVVAKEAYWREPVKWNAAADMFTECEACGWRGRFPRGGRVTNSVMHCPDCDRCGSLRADSRKHRIRPRVFCASLADWLDPEWPIEVLTRLLALIHDTPHLDWLLLTKRPEQWRKRFGTVMDRWNEREDKATANDLRVEIWMGKWLRGEPPANVWIGTTVEDQNCADERIPALLSIPARVRFLSCEPLLGRVQIARWLHTFACLQHHAEEPAFWSTMQCTCAARDLHWVICGGESGDGARPMHPEWARSLRDQCQSARVPFFFKQWGEWCAAKILSETHFQVETPSASPGPKYPEFRHWKNSIPGDPNISAKVGKKTAGRLLDGREHDAFPVAGGRPDEG